MRPTVALLDVNETLSDLAPLGERLDAVGAPRHLLPTWFAATLRDGMAIAAAGGYAGFPEVGLAALRSLLAGVEGLRRPLDEAASHVLDGFAELPVHPDVPEGLRRLRSAGLRLATLTNGSASTAAGLLERAGLGDLVERTLDVREAGRWKPHPAPYLLACETLGIEPGDAVLVAAHPWDVHGAKRAGLQGAWLNRHALPYPDVLLAPDLSAPDLPALAGHLGRD